MGDDRLLRSSYLWITLLVYTLPDPSMYSNFFLWHSTTTAVEAIEAFNSSELQITKKHAQQFFSEFLLVFSGFCFFSTGKYVLWEQNYAGEAPKDYILHSFWGWWVIHRKQLRWKCSSGQVTNLNGKLGRRDREFLLDVRKFKVCFILCVNSPLKL